jgi:hypothetical protein
MRKLAIPLIILGVMLISNLCYALSPEYQCSLKKEFSYLIWKHPGIVYNWGETRPYEGKSDCSGYIFGVYRKLGIPGISRTTALEMRKGRAGWVGRDINIDEANEIDVVWWTWKNSPQRQHGHIGVLIENPKSGLLEVTHASSSQKKVVVEPIKGILMRDLSATRRITIGEKPLTLGKDVVKLK